MTNSMEYPLKQVLEVKIRRVENAEKVVREKQELLKAEQKKLEERKKERDKVLNHHADKLFQLRHELDEASTTSPKIQQMKAYLKVVKEKLKIEEKKVTDQQNQVTQAEKNLELAKEELARKRQEVDKLNTHKEDWQKEMRKEREIIEGREQDELGTITYTIHQRLKF